MFQIECEYQIQIKKISNVLCKSLEDTIRKQRAPRRKCDSQELERIKGVDGCTNLHTKAKERVSGSNSCTLVSNNCFVCRKHLKQDGHGNCVQTYFCYSI